MIQVLNKRASTHPNHCEDNYWVEETEQYVVGAVLDGCSTGIESHFASTLIKHILSTSWKTPITQKSLTELGSFEFINAIFYDVLFNLNVINDRLKLSELHYLSTIVFFVYNKVNKQLFVKFAGDGAVFVVGEGIFFDKGYYIHDENNMPDYIAYHINDSWGKLTKWVKSRHFEWYENVDQFSICTDGIDSFVNLKNPHLDKKIAKDFILNSDKFSNLKTGLNKRFNILTNKNEAIKESDELWYWDIQDDLTIIHYANS